MGDGASCHYCHRASCICDVLDPLKLARKKWAERVRLGLPVYPVIQDQLVREAEAFIREVRAGDEK